MKGQITHFVYYITMRHELKQLNPGLMYWGYLTRVFLTEMSHDYFAVNKEEQNKGLLFVSVYSNAQLSPPRMGVTYKYPAHNGSGPLKSSYTYILLTSAAIILSSVMPVFS